MLQNHGLVNKEMTVVHMFRYYAVSLEQHIFREDDPMKSCVDYTKTTSYNHCDQKYIQTKLEEEFPPGFIPIWLGQNYSEVTRHLVHSQNYSELYIGLVDGSEDSGIYIHTYVLHLILLTRSKKRYKVGNSGYRHNLATLNIP